MKPRLFIGSSVEALPVAYAIQESLEHDALPTVWTQGVFNLSSNTLADLITAADNIDFAIMVFNPDDITTLRQSSMSTVRDNVVFELGLFMGRLGRDRVFFVMPANEKNFHLPTDLTGVTAGTYQAEREDGNLKAALGPFCNQVRGKLKDFVYDNLNDLSGETKEARRIAAEKPQGWEYLLAAELIETRLQEIHRSYLELERGSFFVKSVSFDQVEYSTWMFDRIDDFGNLLRYFTKLMNEDLMASFGAPGVPGRILDIKIVSDRVHHFGKELIAWEYEIRAARPPEIAKGVEKELENTPKGIFETMIKIPAELRRVTALLSDPNVTQEDVNINLIVPPPTNSEQLLHFIKILYS